MSLQSILDQGDEQPVSWTNLKVASVDSATFNGLGLSSGTGTLSGGAVTITDAKCKTTSKVLLTFKEAIGATVGPLSAVAGNGSFAVASNNGASLTFNYIILN